MSIDPNWALVLVAVANAVGGIFIFLNTRATAEAAREASEARVAAEAANAQSRENNVLVQQTREDIRVVEKATNSMKDALVQATADASLLKGRAEVTAEVAAAKLDKPSGP